MILEDKVHGLRLQVIRRAAELGVLPGDDFLSHSGMARSLHHSGSGQSSGAAVLNGCAMVAPQSQAIQTWRSSPPPSNSPQRRCSWLAAYVGTVLVRMVYNLVVAHMF
jgi:hypothetical protein